MQNSTSRPKPHNSKQTCLSLTPLLQLLFQFQERKKKEQVFVVVVVAVGGGGGGGFMQFFFFLHEEPRRWGPPGSYKRIEFEISLKVSVRTMENRKLRSVTWLPLVQIKSWDKEYMEAKLHRPNIDDFKWWFDEEKNNFFQSCTYLWNWIFWEISQFVKLSEVLTVTHCKLYNNGMLNQNSFF